MIRTKLLIGISAAALAAGTASAQTTTDAAGNSSTVNCTPFSGNTCTVNNSTAFNPNNDRDSATINVNGAGNFARITQNGDDDSSTITINGNSNNADHTQNGNRLTSSTTQNGDFNSSTINQGSQGNSASVSQRTTAASLAAQDVSSVAQGTGNDPVNFAGARSSGEDNRLVVDQNGTRLLSTVVQNIDARENSTGFGAQPFSATPASTSTSNVSGSASASDNSTTVIQTGTGSESRVYQTSRGNTAMVRIGGGGSGTSANGSLIKQNNSLYQAGPNGTFVGASGANGGGPTFVGGNGANNGGPNATNNPRDLNAADVSIIGLGNTSYVYQDGVQNSSTVSMLGGGSGNTSQAAAGTTSPAGQALPTNRKQGNDSTIFQQGQNLFAAVSSGGLGGQGNSSVIEQGIQLNGANFTPEDLARDHRATVYQRGILDQVQTIQENRKAASAATTANPTGAQFGSSVDVSQLSFNSSVSVSQFGTNTALVTQGNRNEPNVGGNNSVAVTQNDAGDFPASGGSSGGVFGGGTSGSGSPASNYVAISQNGARNTITVDQNAVNASASVYQTPGATDPQTGLQSVGTSDSSVMIEQGTGANLYSGPVTANNSTANNTNALNLTANVTQSGKAGIGRTNTAQGLYFGVTIVQDGQNQNATATQAGTGTNGTASGNAIGISQVNAWNSATVGQNGSGLYALVEQRGTGTSARPNLVTIQQTGTSNSATARQTQNVGPSGTNTTTNPAAGVAGDPAFPNAHAAGANSAEIVILQSNTGNNGTVEQRGKGQYARLEQSGQNNTGGILQDVNATNAVAILEQRGNSNTFYITQDTAGQYIRVVQNGNNNAATTTTQSSATAGGTGGTVTTNPANAPAFGTVQ